MPAERDLAVLLGSLRPKQRAGRFVFVSLREGDQAVPVVATVLEDEGLTGVVTQEDADRHGLDYDLVCGWITLQVHSALDAVGLTAAVATALTERDIPANVIAGRHHDHVLVPAERVDAAIEALEALVAG